MSIVIPATDAASTRLNGVITALTSDITNAAPNGALVAKLTQDKRNAQYQLVSHLIGEGHLSCASILTNETYISGTSDGL